MITSVEDKLGGPKTEIGKLKSSLNSVIVKTDARNLTKETKVRKMMIKAGVDFSKVNEAIEERNLFEMWIKSKTGEELNEIIRLDKLTQLLEADMTLRSMRKLQKGIPLNQKDINLIRLLKEVLQTSHELKFGRKEVQIKGSFKDIRDLMFPK